MGGSVDWRFAYASVVGRSHVDAGIICQDSSLCTLVQTEQGDVVVASVSDGAGSAMHSDIGSKLACASFEEEVAARLRERGASEPIDRESVETWLADFREAATREAERLGVSARELACTFVGAVIAPSWSSFCQIGDGGIVVDRPTTPAEPGDGLGPFEIVFWPEQGEYANETYFATMAGATDHLQFRVDQRQVRDVAMFSDGMQRLVLQFDVRQPFTPFFRTMFGPVYARTLTGEDSDLSRDLAKYLGSTVVSERTDDDVSLILATQHFQVAAAAPPAITVSEPEPTSVDELVVDSPTTFEARADIAAVTSIGASDSVPSPSPAEPDNP